MEVDAAVPNVPMELPMEEIEMNQNTQHFKTKVYENDTQAILKIPKARENWDVYFNGKDQRFKMAIKLGRSQDSPVVKMTATLSYNPEGPENGFEFRFEPESKIPRSVKQLTGKYCLEFLDAMETPYMTYDSEKVNWLRDTYYGHPDEEIDKYYRELFLTRETALENCNLGEDDTITIRLTFTYCSSEVLEYPNEYRLEEISAKAADKALINDMEALLNNSKDADVKIETSDGVILEAHKLILQTRVPMFCAMFNTDMQERESNTVKTPEISSGAMKIILYYIYTGKLHESWKQWRLSVSELLHGAKQYGLDGLTQYFDYMLITLCNDVDARDLLEVAKLHGLKQAEEDISKWQRGIVME